MDHMPLTIRCTACGFVIPTVQASTHLLEVHGVEGGLPTWPDGEIVVVDLTDTGLATLTREP